ncbi:hypothetical protein [Microbispora sp. H13382]|uniref:hypothetical protein n=1 Tax=Microbispora sp. H13382 TaxID=2729112 RepID=UPI001602C37B|nr:hypothetical protein [Microbispora sp. H13382]
MSCTRVCLAIAVAGTAVLVPTAQASAGTPGPAAVMSKALVQGRGVAFTETSKSWIGDDRSDATVFRNSGVLAFGRGRLAAASVKRVTTSGKTFRFLIVGGRTYAQGGLWSDSLPAGKSWVRSRDLRLEPYQASGQAIDVFEPATLRAVYATRSGGAVHQSVNGVPATRYSGTVTAKALCTVSAACREAFGKSSPVKIGWSLWLDGKGRVVRLTTQWSRRSDSRKGVAGGGEWTDTYYARWGARITVKAPPASRVATV